MEGGMGPGKWNTDTTWEPDVGMAVGRHRGKQRWKTRLEGAGSC